MAFGLKAVGKPGTYICVLWRLHAKGGRHAKDENEQGFCSGEPGKAAPLGKMKMVELSTFGEMKMVEVSTFCSPGANMMFFCKPRQPRFQAAAAESHSHQPPGGKQCCTARAWPTGPAQLAPVGERNVAAATAAIGTVLQFVRKSAHRHLLCNIFPL